MNTIFNQNTTSHLFLWLLSITGLIVLVVGIVKWFCKLSHETWINVIEKRVNFLYDKDLILVKTLSEKESLFAYQEEGICKDDTGAFFSIEIYCNKFNGKIKLGLHSLNPQHSLQPFAS